MLRELFIDPFQIGDTHGIIVSVLLWSLVLLIVGFVLWIAWCSLDTYGVDERVIRGVVKDKHHKESYTTIYMQKIGNATVPQTITHPERWWLEVSTQYGEGEVDVNEDQYIGVKEWDRILVGGKLGKFSGKFYVIRAIIGHRA